MVCNSCKKDKHPQLFRPAEMKKPEGRRRTCRKCMQDYIRELEGTKTQRRGDAWRAAGLLCFGAQEQG
jgi:hypothetical protein